MGNETSSQANIVRMLKLLGISENSVFSDVKRFPSVDDRRKAKFRTDLNATAFHPIQRVFRAMTACRNSEDATSSLACARTEEMD